jgi:general nucleoside transport system permease protein
VSLGEVLTEKSGRVNLGLEGTLLMGAMTGFAGATLTGSPWLGVLAAGAAGAAFGLLHAAICNLPRVNDIAVGIALFLFGIGLAFYLGKPFIAPRAAMLPALPLGAWSDEPAVRAALEISPLFLIGAALAVALQWGIANTRLGLLLRMAGESADAARALGRSVNAIRTLATTTGGFLAGVGGAFLSLYYPGNWNEGLSSGQGLMAIALVIFARWSPLRCLWASLLFGGASALGPALQTVGVTSGYYLYSAAPYLLTLVLLVYSSSTRHALSGAPSELSISR